MKRSRQQYDGVPDQYYLRARYYNPVIGRFTQEDSYYVDGLNLYAYCANHPVGYSDPSGYSCNQDVHDASNGNKGTGDTDAAKPYDAATGTDPVKPDDAGTSNTKNNQNKTGETSAMAMGKKVHKEKADARRASGEYDSVNQKMKNDAGEVIEVPETVSKKTGNASEKSQSSIPDAVKGPDKGGIIYDDKPAGRPISKDCQEMGRNVEAYKEKYGVSPNEIVIERYDPVTGAAAGTESYKPSDFDRYSSTKKK